MGTAPAVASCRITGSKAKSLNRAGSVIIVRNSVLPSGSIHLIEGRVFMQMANALDLFATKFSTWCTAGITSFFDHFPAEHEIRVVGENVNFTPSVRSCH